MDQITTISHLPQEVLYMIMNYLCCAERANCRLVSKHFMRVGSYIFKQITFTSRDQVKLFAESLVKNPCIAAHVQVIYVNNAALLRAINQTNIKQACQNVKKIEILLSQGRGSWAQHLLPYPRLQHPPTLMNDVNAKIILDTYKEQIMTLRLGGKYLNSMSIQAIINLVKSIPNIRTFGLHYLFKEKHKDIHRDLPHTLSFGDLNLLIKQPTLMYRFELHYCEVANQSLIGADTTNTDLILQLRTMRTAPVLLEKSLLDPNNNLTHIEMKFVQVTNVTNFVRSILDSFANLQSLELTFVGRYMILEFCVGQLWDIPHPDAWSRDLQHKPSKLKKLALNTTQSRLNVKNLLEALGKAEAPLQEISIVDSGDRENGSMDLICEQFSTTLQKLTMNCKSNFGVSRLISLIRLESASLHWAHNHFEHLVCPAEILQNTPHVTELELGYNKWYSGMISRPPNFGYEPFINITRITLDRIIINENEMKEFFLPLINLKEAIFRRCMFESSKQENDEHDQEIIGHRSGHDDSDDEGERSLDGEEMFNFMPSTGELEDTVRRAFFKRMETNEMREAAATGAEERRNTDKDGAATSSSTATDTAASLSYISSNASAPTHLIAAAGANTGNTGNNATTTTPATITNGSNAHIDRFLAHALAMIRSTNRRREVRDPSKSKRNNLHILSLSLEHLGLHDCKLREATGGISNARTIRNFEIIQDKRSGCARTYNIDRAYHEKKECNPHVILNKTTEKEDTIGFHYTHEFGGTTGKNDYINTRPTFKIRLFSLEKLSIRLNCLMSIYFTDRYGGRLKSCHSVIKEEVKSAENYRRTVVSQSVEQEIRYPITAVTNDNLPSPSVFYFNTVVDEEMDKALSEDKYFEKERVSCSVRQHNREVNQVNELLSQAFNDSVNRTREVITVDGNDDEDAPLLKAGIFDSDIFQSVKSFKSDCEFSGSSSIATELTSAAESTARPPKNKKTMVIRPF